MTDRSGFARPTEQRADAVDHRAAHRVSPPDSPYPIRWLIAALALFAASAALSLLLHWWNGFIDLEVYRNGAEAWLKDRAVYGPMPPVQGTGLPFTYPPPAALFFIPLAVTPLGGAQTLLLATSVGCLAITLWLVLGRIRPGLSRATMVILVIGAVALTQTLEPVRQTFSYGQINLVLMAAVTLDCLVRKPVWPRGLLVGLATSVKLIPGGFLLYFVLRKDWKAAATTVLATAAAFGAAFLIMPDDSAEYWSKTLSNTDRIGAPYYAGNQSIKGAVFRLGVSDSTATILWLTLSLVTVTLAAIWMRRLLDADAPVAALLVNAAALLLISPISWSHHWVWVAPALVFVVDRIARGKRDPRVVGVVVAAALVLLTAPQWWLPNSEDRELGWAWWQQIIGSGYVLATFAMFVVAVAVYRPALTGVRKAASAAA
ncbi:glycosyltransferase 87 family protein [Nocardia callitridis]|uniref:Glycosyltransferase 87 family protein n=1 Tax=Nocardia callitridis TaxID=648753 RepID=A0ABP9JWL9_9NOCA